MIKTGLEIVEMIAKGKAPKKIKINNSIYEYSSIIKTYHIEGDVCLDLIQCLNDKFEIPEETKVWKPKYDDEYWFIDNCGIIRHDYWLNTDADEFRYNTGNCLKTEEEAEKKLEKIKIYTRLKRFAEEHNTEKIDWNNGEQGKWHIMLYTRLNTIETAIGYVHRDLKKIYFTSKELCEQAIKEIGEDNIKKLFEEE